MPSPEQGRRDGLLGPGTAAFRMSSLIETLSKGRVALAFFVAALAVYLAMMLFTLPHLRELAGGMKPFDLLPGGYDADYANGFLEAIGSEGRAFYLTRQIPLDLIFPGLFAIAFTSVWLWLITKATPVSGILKAGAIAPIFAGLADYVENGFIVAMLIKFPGLSEALVGAASLFTITKSVATALYFVALACLIILTAIGKFQSASTG